MGGERETVSPQKSKSSSGKTEVIGSVRYHESGGEIHFHDDDKGMKVAVPVKVWYQAWQTLITTYPSYWRYVDTDNKTCLNVSVTDDGAAKQVDALIQITKVKVTDDFSKLNKFSAL